MSASAIVSWILRFIQISFIILAIVAVSGLGFRIPQDDGAIKAESYMLRIVQELSLEESFDHNQITSQSIKAIISQAPSSDTFYAIRLDVVDTADNTIISRTYFNDCQDTDQTCKLDSASIRRYADYSPLIGFNGVYGRVTTKRLFYDVAIARPVLLKLEYVYRRLG